MHRTMGPDINIQYIQKRHLTLFFVKFTFTTMNREENVFVAKAFLYKNKKYVNFELVYCSGKKSEHKPVRPVL